MPKPKVTYFDFAGSRGEEVRLALTLAGVDFEDVRVKFPDWAALKPTTPFGSMPLFEIEGRGVLAQSNAILVYIGREHGLHPKDNWEAARHEALLAAAEELRANVIPVLRVKDDADPEVAINARKELAEGFLQTWGRNIEAQLGDGPFVAGEAIHVADVKLYMVAKWFSSGGVDHVPKDVFGAFPKLTRLERAVAEHPKVVARYAG